MGQKEDVRERLANLSDAVTAGRAESWAPEAAALRRACETLPAGKLPDRCLELEKLRAPEEARAAELIFDAIVLELAGLIR